ncbi:MAG: DUF4956 domain-containing protein [Woeseiaceae bacterium]
MIDGVRTRLFWKVGIYYGACFALVITAGLTHPEWMRFLPFGGLDALQQGPTLTDGESLAGQTLATHRPVRLFDDAMNLLSALAGTLVVMIPLRWLYMTEGPNKSWNKAVATSLLVLPLVVAAIVYVVKYSLPLAFALTGIFAGVRYRTTLKNQSDAFFTFACIAVGLSAGTRALGIGLLLATFFAFTILVVSTNNEDPQRETSPGPPSTRL